jgi:hypothetical protein
MAETYLVSDHFVNKDPIVRTLYDQLVLLLRTKEAYLLSE